jgi:nucleoside-diphosphate-sugar epimerase
VEAGHSVVNISRGQRRPYREHRAWTCVEQVVLDRPAEETGGSFGAKIRDLKPDAVIDLTCYTLESAQQLVEALRGHVAHFLHCGTTWVHGTSVVVPTTEDQAREPFGEYGCRKAAIEQFLLLEARRNGFPATILHPGHLVGPGWVPINPAGNLNPQVFSDLARGNEVLLPNLGRECLHHVHADDVAQAFVKALDNWSVATGEAFHVVSPAAVTLHGYAHAVAHWFGKTARLRFLPWEEWKQTVSGRDAEITWGHISRSCIYSIEKARRLLQYQPRYQSFEAIREAVFALVENGAVAAP